MLNAQKWINSPKQMFIASNSLETSWKNILFGNSVHNVPFRLTCYYKRTEIEKEIARFGRLFGFLAIVRSEVGIEWHDIDDTAEESDISSNCKSTARRQRTVFSWFILFIYFSIIFRNECRFSMRLDKRNAVSDEFSNTKISKCEMSPEVMPQMTAMKLSHRKAANKLLNLFHIQAVRFSSEHTADDTLLDLNETG